jgi:hypothetical protein
MWEVEEHPGLRVALRDVPVASLPDL